jgi:hypothetical protein
MHSEGLDDGWHTTSETETLSTPKTATPTFDAGQALNGRPLQHFQATTPLELIKGSSVLVYCPLCRATAFTVTQNTYHHDTL